MATDMATGISATTEGILDMVDGIQAGVAASMQGWAQEDTILGVSQSSCTCIVMTALLPAHLDLATWTCSCVCQGRTQF